MCVQVRFTRAFKGLIFPPSEPPGEIMSFGVSPVNYSDSDSDLVGAFDKFGDSLRNRPDISGHSPALRSDFCGMGGIVCLFVIHCLLWAHFMYPLSNVI